MILIGFQVLAVAQTVTSWYCMYFQQRQECHWPPETDLIYILDIKTNFVGIHIWDIPPDYDQRIGQVVRLSICFQAVTESTVLR